MRSLVAAAGPGLVATVAVAALALVALDFFRGRLHFTLSGPQYLAFHTPAELFAALAGLAMFAVHWHAASARGLGDSRALFLGTAFLGVALIHTLHALALPGMPGMVEPGSTDRGIYYWRGARLWRRSRSARAP